MPPTVSTAKAEMNTELAGAPPFWLMARLSPVSAEFSWKWKLPVAVKN